jgi:hypothetical protein
MNFAPIVVFVYNRLEHTRRTIEALSKNSLAKESEVFIYSDAPKPDEGLEKVQMTRQLIDSIVDKSLFKSVTIIKAEKNRGLANSVIQGVTEIINQYGKVIVVEDDLITTPDFLNYMNKALDFYKDDQVIWSISGYSFKMKIPKSYHHDIFYSYRASSWGYATWADRWNTVDWDVKDYDDFKTNRAKRRLMNRGGRDMARMLDFQMIGRIDSWAIRWCYEQSKQNKLTVYPVHSRVKNIGLDGSGTHSKDSKKNKKWDSLLNSSEEEIIFEKLEIDKRIARIFRNRYGTLMSLAFGEFKRLVKTIVLRVNPHFLEN